MVPLELTACLWGVAGAVKGAPGVSEGCAGQEAHGAPALSEGSSRGWVR